MSRVANSPVELPSGVEVTISGQQIKVKGGKGTLEMTLHDRVEVTQQDNVLTFATKGSDKIARAMSGTIRALVNNMVQGVSAGFQRKLELNGVGYRAKASGSVVNLSLGFSHPVDYQLPDGISAETPTQTEIVLSGIDKQLIGQVAAKIRSLRPPEPYKGKGIKYVDEVIRRKAGKQAK